MDFLELTKLDLKVWQTIIWKKNMKNTRPEKH